VLANKERIARAHDVLANKERVARAHDVLAASL